MKFTHQKMSVSETLPKEGNFAAKDRRASLLLE